MTWIQAHLSEFMELYSINFINLISPGAGFALMVRNSTAFGRKVGLYTALGITSSSLIHKTYTLLGFGLIVSQTPWLYLIIKYMGSGYLFYLGIQSLSRAVSMVKNVKLRRIDLEDKSDLSALTLTAWGGFRNGFFVDMMNPSASLAFVCIVASTVSPLTSLSVRFIYMILLILTSLSWYSFLALTFSSQRLNRYNHVFGHWLEATMGGFLIYLSQKLFFAPLPTAECQAFQERIIANLL